MKSRFSLVLTAEEFLFLLPHYDKLTPPSSFQLVQRVPAHFPENFFQNNRIPNNRIPKIVHPNDYIPKTTLPKNDIFGISRKNEFYKNWNIRSYLFED